MSADSLTPILYLAPMLGLSDAAFRVAYQRHFGGVDRAISPFLKTLQGGLCKDSKIEDLNPRRQADMELYPQILSNQVDDFVAIAKRLFDMGYLKINLNLGCPVPMAAGRGRGAGLLPHPDYVDRLLDGILSHIPNQLSVKTRLGYESDRDLMTMCAVFNRYPLFAVAIHPRTAKQGYGGTVDLERFAEAVSQLQSPVIYSGDIVSVEDFTRLRCQFPTIYHWMVGRGLLQHPSLPMAIRRRIQGLPEDNFAEPNWAMVADFYEDLVAELKQRRWEDHAILMRLKTLAFYRADGVGLESRLVKQVRKARTCDDLLELVRMFPDDSDQERVC